MDALSSHKRSKLNLRGGGNMLDGRLVPGIIHEPQSVTSDLQATAGPP